MCGRYYRIADKQAIVDHFHSPSTTDEAFPPGYNIAPGTTQPVIRQGRDTGARELVGMRWGLVGFGSSGPDPKRVTFNARSENLTKSDLWCVPLHKRRCLVPISGYYEWRKPDKVPFRFTLRDEPLYALAGLWDAWKNPAGDWLQSFSIITVDASAAMSTIHDRMPAILMPTRVWKWLDRGEIYWRSDKGTRKHLSPPRSSLLSPCLGNGEPHLVVRLRKNTMLRTDRRWRRKSLLPSGSTVREGPISSSRNSEKARIWFGSQSEISRRVHSAAYRPKQFAVVGPDV